MSIWKCRLCPAHGNGGPDGWLNHAHRIHGKESTRLHSVTNFAGVTVPAYKQGGRIQRPTIVEAMDEQLMADLHRIPEMRFGF